MKTWIIAASLGIALSAAGSSCVFAQAGSTGGTLGNTDKSISGERETPAPSQGVKRKANPVATENGCREIVGLWTFRVPPLSWEVAVKSNGTATHSIDGGVTGTWTCHGDSVVFVWANGRYLDHVTLLSRDALEGTNIQGIRFTGTRR